MMKFEKVSISVDQVVQWRKWPWNEWKSPPKWVREPPSTTKFLEWGNIAGKLMRVKKEMDESANHEMNLHVIWRETVEKHHPNQMATLLPPQNDEGSTWGTRARTLSSSQIAKHCCSIFLRGRWYSQGTVDRWHLRRSVILYPSKFTKGIFWSPVKEISIQVRLILAHIYIFNSSTCRMKTPFR